MTEDTSQCTNSTIMNGMQVGTKVWVFQPVGALPANGKRHAVGGTTYVYGVHHERTLLLVEFLGETDRRRVIVRYGRGSVGRW